MSFSRDNFLILNTIQCLKMAIIMFQVLVLREIQGNYKLCVINITKKLPNNCS